MKKAIDLAAQEAITTYPDGSYDFYPEDFLEVLQKLGFVILPKEPTEGMIAEAVAWDFKNPQTMPQEEVFAGIYRAMTQASEK